MARMTAEQMAKTLNPAKAMAIEKPVIVDGRVRDISASHDYNDKLRNLKAHEKSLRDIGIYTVGTDPELFYLQYKHSLTALFDKKPWRYPTAEILAESIGEYFRIMFENHQSPTVAGLCSWLGISTATLKKWEENQNSMPYFDVMSNAVNFIQALIEQGAVNSTISAQVYQFMGKNYFGMSDSNRIEHIVVDKYSDADKQAIIDDMDGVLDVDFEEIPPDAIEDETNPDE